MPNIPRRFISCTLPHVAQGERSQDILEEIIARSKEKKIEKARSKEEQESERERLDEGIGELFAMLNRRPAKGDTKRKSESDDFDVTMRVRNV